MNAVFTTRPVFPAVREAGSMAERAGHCLCGAVRFTARNVPGGYGACHCDMCRRWTGSAFLGVTVRGSDLAWRGEDNIARLQSSAWAERAWCRTCGTGLWYRVTAEGPMLGDYEIPIGLFDDADGLEMQREIYIDRKPDAFAFQGEHELLTEAQVTALYGATMEGSRP